MKKIFYYFLIILGVFCFNLSVNAEVYQNNDLISVNTLATVENEKFTYQDFMFNSNVDAKGNATIVFNAIKNNSNTKEYISINLLIFDEEQKNIGLVAYCTKLDYDSDFANYQIKGNDAIPFSIKVSSKYFTEGKGVKDVKYVAVMDDNKYCKIGGFENYEGLTIKQITAGEVTIKEKSDSASVTLKKDNLVKVLIVIGIFILILVIVCVITGIILNALYKRMFAKATGLAYLPYYSNYLAVKLSFGELPSKIYLGCLLVGILLSFMKINFLTYINSFIGTIAIIVVIIKLITKKYDLFYYDPDNTFKNPVNNNTNLTGYVESTSNNSFIDRTNISDENENKNEKVNLSSDDIVNLDYDKADIEEKDIFSSMNDISTGMITPGTMNANSLDNNMNNSMANQLNSLDGNEKNEDKNEEESDLSRFFR